LWATLSGGQLLDHPHRQRRGQWPISLLHAVHVDTVDDWHYQIQPAVDFPGVVDRDDVRFGQPGGGMGFAPEPFPIPRLRARLGRQHLDRHITADHGVMGFEHLAHAALADQLKQPVAAK
jgi:hypothetical protein